MLEGAPAPRNTFILGEWGNECPGREKPLLPWVVSNHSIRHKVLQGRCRRSVKREVMEKQKMMLRTEGE